ncbi:uncharacterized protein EI90DRAFT_3292183 [Cantharellus anzutake]|uniref:uncharacterized protein n=1 Tax=Cantharellus anzutake TaxID=1750568 RepID=UPI0019030442|nr:uncharacterized protein EI90DRAFT_3292183 [Cantharellus anzutake]KAF8324263.1 hypothetical protein EI90DRAFT_3292183 [Cantharellus anzutake]
MPEEMFPKHRSENTGDLRLDFVFQLHCYNEGGSLLIRGEAPSRQSRQRQRPFPERAGVAHALGKSEPGQRVCPLLGKPRTTIELRWSLLAFPEPGQLARILLRFCIKNPADIALAIARQTKVACTEWPDTQNCNKLVMSDGTKTNETNKIAKCRFDLEKAFFSCLHDMQCFEYTKRTMPALNTISRYNMMWGYSILVVVAVAMFATFTQGQTQIYEEEKRDGKRKWQKNDHEANQQ